MNILRSTDTQRQFVVRKLQQKTFWEAMQASDDLYTPMDLHTLDRPSSGMTSNKSYGAWKSTDNLKDTAVDQGMPLEEVVYQDLDEVVKSKNRLVEKPLRESGKAVSKDDQTKGDQKTLGEDDDHEEPDEMMKMKNIIKPFRDFDAAYDKPLTANASAGLLSSRKKSVVFLGGLLVLTAIASAGITALILKPSLTLSTGEYL